LNSPFQVSTTSRIAALPHVGQTRISSRSETALDRAIRRDDEVEVVFAMSPQEFTLGENHEAFEVRGLNDVEVLDPGDRRSLSEVESEEDH
jgi:hypothetical protein